MPNTTDFQYKKGQYVICRYNGDNGDLIVGRVESARNRTDDAPITLINLITNNRSTKERSVLYGRNIVVPKCVADKVVQAWAAHNIREAKRLAVQIAKSVGAQERMEEENVRVVRVPILCLGNRYCSPDCAYNLGQVASGATDCQLYSEYRNVDSNGLTVRCHMCFAQELKEEEHE
jgi:hypothetical protein